MALSRMKAVSEVGGKMEEMPLPTCVIRPQRGLVDSLDVAALWEYRELLYFQVWRDVKVRYKQTVIGAGWAILQPAMSVAIFTLIFGNFVKVPSDGMPYAVFVYTALLPWMYFSSALSRSGTSLVGNANLITKVYFPRLLIPIASVMAPAVDFLFAFVVLLGLIAWYGIVPVWGVVTLPLYFLLAMMTALAIGLWLAPLNARYRDVGHAIPFLTQIWMFASPVVYPVSLVPESWRLVYSLNPMVGVIEGFRWALLGKGNPDFTPILVSVAVVLVLLAGGLFFFKRMERTLADTI